MINILIIDDERSSGNILKLLIENHIDAACKVTCCQSVKDALALLPSVTPSLVMLDIEMPKLSGFDFLNMSMDNTFDVIFTTAYDKYAIKAIRFSALDYLLKPIDIVDLQNAINRHIIRQQHLGQRTQFSNLFANLQSRPADFKLALSASEGVFFFEPPEILYCEAESNYTRFTFTQHKPMLVSKTLGEYEDLLSEYGFLRIHKSYLVNTKYVTNIDRDGLLQMSNNVQLPVAKRRKEMVMNHLKQH